MSIPFAHKFVGRPGAVKIGFADQCPVCGRRPPSPTPNATPEALTGKALETPTRQE